MRNKAFTMVELLAATALSTLLFIAALSVIRTLQPARSTSTPTSANWTLAVRQQIEWDLTNAVVFRQDEHGLILGGYGSLSSAGSAETHLPVMVTYALQIIHSRQWLVRQQTSLDPLMSDLDNTQLLCGDVKSFTITGSYASRNVPADTTSAEEDPTPMVFQHLSRTQRVPDQIRVRIDMQNDPLPVMNSILYLR
jgi:hypothetical protein